MFVDVFVHIPKYLASEAWVTHTGWIPLDRGFYFCTHLRLTLSTIWLVFSASNASSIPTVNFGYIAQSWILTSSILSRILFTITIYNPTQWYSRSSWVGSALPLRLWRHPSLLTWSRFSASLIRLLVMFWRLSTSGSISVSLRQDKNMFNTNRPGVRHYLKLD